MKKNKQQQVVLKCEREGIIFYWVSERLLRLRNRAVIWHFWDHRRNTHRNLAILVFYKCGFFKLYFYKRPLFREKFCHGIFTVFSGCNLQYSPPIFSIFWNISFTKEVKKNQLILNSNSTIREITNNKGEGRRLYEIQQKFQYVVRFCRLT